MALIKCPECKLDVSDKAETCPHCGLNISDYLEHSEQIIICPKCGSSNLFHSKDTCCICDTKVVNTHKLFSYKYDRDFSIKEKIIEESFDELKSLGLYDPEMHDIRLKVNRGMYTSLNPTDKEVALFEKYSKKLKEMREQDGFYKSQPTQSQPEQPKAPIVKCPNCGSTNTQRITATSRVAGVLTLGLASGSIGKQYKCKACKYKW